jgi:6-phosphofructokinase 2
MPSRIVTLTLNPAVDIACNTASVQPTHKNRTFGDRLDPGGGGINVARVVHALGGDALALIMSGGITGRLIEELLDEVHLPWKALPVQGRSRLSLNVHDERSGLEYRFVPEGPAVSEAEWQAALQALREVEAEWVVASGSLPPGVPTDFYARAAEIAVSRNQRFALDTSGAALRAALGHGIELLKLSLRELESVVARELPDDRSQEREAMGLVERGATRLVALSLGEKGAVLVGKDVLIRMAAPTVSVRTAVGAGDSFLAGLVLGLSRGLPYFEALAYGTAAGAAAVTTFGTAHVDVAEVERLYGELIKQHVRT